LDIEYARTKSLWLDLKVIFKTLPALLVQVREAGQHRKNQSQPAKTEARVPLRVANR